MSRSASRAASVSPACSSGTRSALSANERHQIERRQLVRVPVLQQRGENLLQVSPDLRLAGPETAAPSRAAMRARAAKRPRPPATPPSVDASRTRAGRRARHKAAAPSRPRPARRRSARWRAAIRAPAVPRGPKSAGRARPQVSRRRRARAPLRAWTRAAARGQEPSPGSSANLADQALGGFRLSAKDHRLGHERQQPRAERLWSRRARAARSRRTPWRPRAIPPAAAPPSPRARARSRPCRRGADRQATRRFPAGRPAAAAIASKPFGVRVLRLARVFGRCEICNSATASAPKPSAIMVWAASATLRAARERRRGSGGTYLRLQAGHQLGRGDGGKIEAARERIGRRPGRPRSPARPPRRARRESPTARTRLAPRSA